MSDKHLLTSCNKINLYVWSWILAQKQTKDVSLIIDSIDVTKINHNRLNIASFFYMIIGVSYQFDLKSFWFYLIVTKNDLQLSN